MVQDAVAAPPTPKGPQAPRTFNAENTQFFSIAMLQLGADVPAWVKDAQEHLRNKRYPEAQKTAEAGLQQNPRTLDGLLYLAEAHWEQVHPKEAVDHLKQAIQVAPKDSRPYALLGRYLLLKGLREQAVKFLEQAVTLNPEDAQSRKQLDRTRNLIKRGYKKVEAAPGVMAGTEAKKEATRMTRLSGAHSIVPEDGAAALPLGSVDIEQALGALLSAALLELDVASVKAGKISSGRGLRFFGGLVVLVAALVAGIPGGFLVRKQMQFARAGTPLQQATALVSEDSVAGYIQATELLEKLNEDDPDTKAAQPLLALAHAVRAAELGGGSFHRERAATALEATPDALKASGAALMARHLLAAANGKPDTALDQELTQALGGAPDDAWLHLVKGRRLESSGDDGAALTTYRTAYRLAPTLPLAVHHLARAHARLGDKAEALRLVDRLLELAPNHGGAMVLGLLLSMGDDAGRAAAEARIQTLLGSNGVHPDNAAFAATALALILQSEAKGEQAAPLWVRAAGMGEDRTAGYWALGRARLAMADLEGARTLIGRAVEKDESDLRFHKDLARAEVTAARGPEWLAHMKATFKEDTLFPTLRFPLGTVHVHVGSVVPLETVLDSSVMPDAEIAAALDVPELGTLAAIRKVNAVKVSLVADAMVARGLGKDAIDAVKEALTDNKRDVELLLALARTQASLQQWEDAQKTVQAILTEQEAEPRALLQQAILQVATGEGAEALRTLTQLERAGVVSPRIPVLRARAMLQKKQLVPADKELARAREQFPGDPDVMIMSAELMLQKKDWEGANAALVAVLKVDPQRAETSIRAQPLLLPAMGRALAEAGHAEQAVGLLQKLVVAQPDDGDALFALGMAQAAAGQQEPARLSLQKFLDWADPKDVRRGVAERALNPVPPTENAAGTAETPEKTEAPGKEKAEKKKKKPK